MKFNEIRERAQRVVDRPVRLPDSERLDRAYERFRNRSPRSAALAKKMRGAIARGSQHTLPPCDPYAVFMDKGRGSRVRDVDGNEYVDYILSGGAILLGHSHPGLNRSIVELIQRKTNFHGFFDELEILAAEKIIEHFPSVERVRFTSSGAEAVLGALRIARAFTGRTKIVKYRGSYHGWGGEVVTDIEVPHTDRFMSTGIPTALLDETVLVTPNDLDRLEDALRARDIAAVICEPFGGESGLVPFEEDFHRKAIELAHAYGTLYVFDEVVTGLRTGLGGAQAELGVTPDLTTLGKGLMNGYPSCGAIGGLGEIVDTANTSLPLEAPSAYIGGTLSGNTLSVAACYHNILELERPGVLDHAFAMAEDLVAKLNALFEQRGSEFFAYRFGAIIRIELTAPHAVPLDREDRLDDVLLRRSILSKYMIPVYNGGVMSRMGRDMISCSHSREDNDRAVTAYEALLDVLA